MSKTQTFGAAAALMTLLFAASAFAQLEPSDQKPPPNVPELEAEALQAYQDKNWVRMYSMNMKLHQLRPHVPEYMINIVLAAASVERKNTAYHFMVKLQSQGLSYDFNQYEETAAIRGTEAYDYVNDLMIKAGEPAGEGKALFKLDLAPPDLGDVAWDPSRERFLVGTRREGTLFAVDDDGGVELLLQANENNGLWSIDGLAVDPERNRLWIASNATPVFVGFEPSGASRGALFEYTLDTLEQVGRHRLPTSSMPHALGSVAVTANGDVYVIDRATPIIFRKTMQGPWLETFAGGQQLVALTDLAVTPDNSRLFVADAVMGILVIDPLARRSAMLEGPENLNLSGIYNIEFADSQLFVTQSGVSPQRVVRLGLNPNGATVDTVSPMASALDGFDTPGAGTLRGDSLYYIANHGSGDADSLMMMATPLDAGSAIKPPEMKQFEEAMKNSARRASEQ